MTLLRLSAQRINKYDGETEYWVDTRTHGTRGSHEVEGLRDSTSAKGKVDSLGNSSKPEDLDKNWNHDEEPAGVEEGKDKAPRSKLYCGKISVSFGGCRVYTIMS